MRADFAGKLVEFLALSLNALLFIAVARLLVHDLNGTEVLGFTAALSLYAAAVFELAALSVALVGTRRLDFWKRNRRGSRSLEKTAHFRNPYLIINPWSGGGRAMKAHIDEMAENIGIHVLIMGKNDDMAALANKAAKQGADVLGVSGGDGSLGAVAKVALTHDLPMVVLPGGTRCHFARDLGLDPGRIVDALEGFNGTERRIDVADLNGRIVMNNASFGLYADIVNHPRYRKHKVEVSRSVLRSLATGQKELYDLQFRYLDRETNRAAQVLVGVNRYNTLNIFELGHRKRLDEGILQITAITTLNNATARELLRVVRMDLLGRHEAIPDFYQWTAESFCISTNSDSLIAGVDGERVELTPPVRITIKPGALRVFVPDKEARLRPAHLFGSSMLERLVHTLR